MTDALPVKVKLSWRWTAASALHLGSGLAAAIGPDGLVARDDDGVPWIPRDAVKGALHLSAARVLGWQGADLEKLYHSDANGTGPPRRGLLHALFSGEGCHYYAGRANPDRPAPHVGRVSSTALNSDTGTAKRNTLREVEFVDRRASFVAGCEVYLPRHLADAATTLLVASLCATETVGADSGVGFGQVDLRDVVLLRADEKAELVDWVSAQRLAALLAPPDDEASNEDQAAASHDAAPEGQALRLKPEQAAGLASAQTGDAAESKPVWYRVDIELAERSTFGAGPLVGNEILTEGYIQATTLRGALIARLGREGGLSADLESCVGLTARWSPCFPVADDQVCVPVPLSWMRIKGETGVGGSGGVTDRLEPAEAVATGVRRERVSEHWMTSPDPAEGPGETMEPDKKATMHVARHRITGSKRQGALFSREALARGAQFRTWVQIPKQGAEQMLAGQVLLGKRRSVQGQATLSATEEQPPWLKNREADEATWDDAVVRVALLGPALVVDPDTGLPLERLGAGTWAQLAGVERGTITTCEASSNTERRGGWVSTWRHERATETMLAPRSVWRLVCPSKQAATALRTALRALSQRGLGERTHEGFGAFWVDPPWLGLPERPRTVKSDTPDLTCPPSATGMPAEARWPGCAGDGSDADALVRIAGKLPESVPAEHLKAIREVGRRARVSPGGDLAVDYTTVLEFGADNRGPHPAVKALLSTASASPAVGQFALHALRIRACRAPASEDEPATLGAPPPAAQQGRGGDA